VLALVGVVAVSFGAAMTMLVLGSGTWAPPSTGADAFSRSAIGHRAFVELLRELDIPVHVSRYQTHGRGGPDALLVVAEPDLSGSRDRRVEFERMLDHGGPVLVVLPKRRGDAGDDSRWLRSSSLLPFGVAERVLEAIDRPLPGSRVEGDGAPWESRLGAVPSVVAPAQVLEPRGVEELATSSAGALVAHVRSEGGARGDVWVLSDPDVLASHGRTRRSSRP
jgi:hypothetical protein